MGSSGGDYSIPPQGPAPPAGSIAPQGTSTGYTPRFINFLGDPGGPPATGLTPDMLAQIEASNGPPPGTFSPPPSFAAAAAPRPQQPAADPRAALAMQMAQRGDPTGRAGRIARPNTAQARFVGTGGHNAR